MNTSTQNTPNHRQHGGMLLNVGLGIVVGLIAALAAVYFAMNDEGGPFKNLGNQPTLESNGQSTDPNAPLYGALPLPLDPSDNVPASPGDGVGALTGGAVPAEPKTGKAAAVKTPENDPLAAMINGSNDKKPDTKTTQKPTDKPVDKPASKTVEPSKPKAVTPKPAPNSGN